MFLLPGFVNAENVCTKTSGCEGTIGPIYGNQAFQEDDYFGCLWTQFAWPPYQDRCMTGGEWYHYGPDDSGVHDSYVCYYCDEGGLNCDTIRSLDGGTSRLVCTDCDCRDYLSGFPAPPCAPITEESCVDEKCCVDEESFTDYRDGEVYTENPGKYISCVASARKDCGLMPAKDSAEIQKKAAKSKIFNPSIYADVIITLTLFGVGYLIFKKI